LDKLDLLVFGDTAVDYFYKVNRFPRISEAAEVTEARRFYGGMGANTAVVANALGLKVGLVSVIGTDAEDYRTYMHNMGIKLFLKGIFGDTTKSMFFKKNGEEVSFFYKGVTEKLEELNLEKDVDRELLRSSRAVYMGRTYLKLQKQVVKGAENKFVVYNPGYGVFKFEKISRDFKTILKNVDVLILNQHELDHLRSLGFKIKFTLGPKFFIITKGAKGCSIYAKSTEVNVNAYETEVVDASGAGDAFNAGFISAYLRGEDVYDAAKAGNATSSFIVEKWGCQTNLPSWEEVLERRKKIR
jgi:ribokinase